MPSKRIYRSSDDIIGALISGEKGGTADFYKSLTRNALVREGHSAGVLDDEEFQSSLLYDNTVVKSYLWTFLDDPVHRSRVREYVLQCSTLQQRAYFTLKTAYFACVTGELGLEYNEASFVTALLHKPAEAFCDIVLPEHRNASFSHPICDIIDAVKMRYPLLDDFADVDALRLIATQSGLDNTKKYMATKIRTAVFNHITIHLYRRIGGSMHSRRVDDDTDVQGMMELFMSGLTQRSISSTDRREVEKLRRIFVTDKQAVEEGFPLPDVSTTDPSHEMVMLHLECCRLAEGTDGEFSPFPNAALGRSYHRLCSRLAQLILKVKSFEVTFHLGREASKQRGKQSRTLRHGRRKGKKRNGFFTLRTMDKTAMVSSIETDGVGISIVIAIEKPMKRFKTPESETKTEAQKRAFAQEMKQREIDRLAPLIPRAIVKGLDPGRVNLYTTSTKSDDGSHDRRFYSRKRHLERSGRNRMQAWRDERTSLPLVSEALKALSLSAGAHGCDASKWTVYMSARRVHRTVLWNEFMYNDERCKKRMVEYRLGQRALARAADHLVSEGILQKKPVIIGYGTGRGNGGGHKGEPSVPVKAMYRALKMAFKRHRLEGGILNVWEHYTTQKCHRCEQIMATRDVPWTQEDIEKEEKKRRRQYDQGVSAAEREESPDIAAKVRELEKLLRPDPPSVRDRKGTATSEFVSIARQMIKPRRRVTGTSTLR